MVHVDAFSRNPLPVCFVLDETEEGLMARLKKAQMEDENIKRLYNLAMQNQSSEYILRGGLLYKEGVGDLKLVIPKVMQSQIIRKAHENISLLVRLKLW